MGRIIPLNRRLSAKKFAFVVALAGALGWSVSPAHETATAGSVGASLARATTADLESAFWECDYTVTTSGVGLGEGALCGEIQDELKRRKFGGDFQAMLTWWQQKKAREHQVIAARRRESASH